MKNIFVNWKTDRFLQKIKERHIIGNCVNFFVSIYIQMQIYSKVVVETAEITEYGDTCTYSPVIDIKSNMDGKISYICGLSDEESDYMIISIIEIALEFYMNNKYMNIDDMSKYAYIMRGNVKTAI